MARRAPTPGRKLVPRAPKRMRVQRDVYVFCDNDTKVRAPFDAAQLAARLGAPTGQHASGKSSGQQDRGGDPHR